MANHLMSGHAPPTSLAVLTHSAQTIEQFAPGAMIEESFHRPDGRSTLLCNNAAAAQPRPRKLLQGTFRFSSSLDATFLPFLGSAFFPRRCCQRMMHLVANDSYRPLTATCIASFEPSTNFLWSERERG